MENSFLFVIEMNRHRHQQQHVDGKRRKNKLKVLFLSEIMGKHFQNGYFEMMSVRKSNEMSSNAEKAAVEFIKKDCEWSIQSKFFHNGSEWNR